jgi:hypothetical protein
MQHQCWKKCVLRLGESELSVSEGLCADRCVKKYMEVPTTTLLAASSPSLRALTPQSVFASSSSFFLLLLVLLGQVHNRAGKVLQGLQQPQPQ